MSPAAPTRLTGAAERTRASARSFVDPAALMRIRSLELRAKVVMEGFLSGLHRSPYHGFSVEFTEYRQYSPGDDPRYLDWKLFARSDRYYLRKFEDETNLRCYLVVDLSRSMGFGTLVYNKADYAITLAATFAYFLSLQRDAVGLLTFDAKIRDYIPPRFRPGHLHRLMKLLQSPPAGDETDLKAPLEQIAMLARKRGMVVILSDFLTPVESLKKQLSQLRARGHEVILLRITDPAERTFTFPKEALFVDLETDRDIYIDPDAARAGYLERFHAHETQLSELCATLGIEILPIATEKPLELALFDLLHARMQKGRAVMRKSITQAGGG